MTVDFQTWMRAVWTSLTEPTAMARHALTLQFPRNALWMGLSLSAVLNVILLVTLQYLSNVPIAMEEQAIASTPFGYLAVVTVFLGLLVPAIYVGGQMLGGIGTADQTLLIMVWFQAISLTLEVVQLALVLISPAIAAIFGLVAFGALLWCFVNFINVLHGFNSIGKAVITIFLSLIVTALVSGIVLSLFGITPPGATA